MVFIPSVEFHRQLIKTLYVCFSFNLSPVCIYDNEMKLILSTDLSYFYKFLHHLDVRHHPLRIPLRLHLHIVTGLVRASASHTRRESSEPFQVHSQYLLQTH